ncbi:MAG: XRE family transcriptional regulator [bacterium]|nr:XRE family transcriptional regulator [bacterium]MDE0667491.1 XRE family transcriptional regulator [bacterium]MYB24069.1 helix-turn-helix domain-containing protein [Acidimicrobiia bacterium]
MPESLDTLVLGHRIRHERRRKGLTLAALGELVGRPAPYLSRLENGRIEPRLSLLADLAKALGCAAGDLLGGEAPTRRAELEVRLARIQQTDAYHSLRLPELKATARLPDVAIEHILALHEAWQDGAEGRCGGTGAPAVDPVRRANIVLRAQMRARGNYYGEIEEAATAALEAVAYPGSGPISERILLDLAGHLGYRIDRVRDIPRSTRSVTDLRRRVIYIPQRDELPTRASRSVVLSTLGHFALDHSDPATIEDYLRQRVESNYFAGAVLAPESPAVSLLQEAAGEGDIAVQDLKDVFSVSYEMAAHRLTNLATRHLGIPMHFMRADEEGLISKAYENDDVPFPTAPDGSLEGVRIPSSWAPRQVFHSADTYDTYAQYTETEAGDYFCVTQVDTTRDHGHTVTVGTTAAHASRFRGSDTARRIVAPQPAGGASGSGQPSDRRVWASARDREFVLGPLTSPDGALAPSPGVSMSEVHAFLDRHASDAG